jgi:hypothetical protein
LICPTLRPFLIRMAMTESALRVRTFTELGIEGTLRNEPFFVLVEIKTVIAIGASTTQPMLTHLKLHRFQI